MQPAFQYQSLQSTPKQKTMSISNKFSRAKILSTNETPSVNQSNMALSRIAQNYRIIQQNRNKMKQSESKYDTLDSQTHLAADTPEKNIDFTTITPDNLECQQDPNESGIQSASHTIQITEQGLPTFGTMLSPLQGRKGVAIPRLYSQDQKLRNRFASTSNFQPNLITVQHQSQPSLKEQKTARLQEDMNHMQDKISGMIHESRTFLQGDFNLVLKTDRGQDHIPQHSDDLLRSAFENGKFQTYSTYKSQYEYFNTFNEPLDGDTSSRNISYRQYKINSERYHRDSISPSSEAKIENMFNTKYEVVSNGKVVNLPEIIHGHGSKRASLQNVKTMSQYSLFSSTQNPRESQKVEQRGVAQRYKDAFGSLNIKTPGQKKLGAIQKTMLNQLKAKGLSPKHHYKKSNNKNSLNQDTVTNYAPNDYEGVARSEASLSLGRSKYLSQRSNAQMILTGQESQGSLGGIENYEKVSRNHSQAPEWQISQEKAQKYYFDRNFQKMDLFLQQLREARLKNNVVEQKIQQAAKECDLDPQNLMIEIQELIQKRIKMNQKDQDLQIAKDNRCGCQVRNISKDFLITKQRHKKVRQLGLLPCSHGVTRDELVQSCVEDFQKLLKFKMALKKNLEYEHSQNDIITSLIRVMTQDRVEDANTMAFFRDTEKIKRILGDPLVEIIESPDEMKKEYQRVSNRGPGDTLQVSEGKQIYETKQFVTLSSRANQTLKLVSEGIHKQRNPSPDPDDIAEQENMDGKEKALKLLQSGAKKGGSNNKAKRGQICIEQLINESVQKELQLIEADPETMESQRRLEKLKQKELINQQILFSVDLANECQKRAVIESVRSSKYRYERDEEADTRSVDTEEAASRRKYELSGHDENFSFKAHEYLEQTALLIKQQNKIESKLIQLRPQRKMRVQPKASLMSQKSVLDSVQEGDEIYRQTTDNSQLFSGERDQEEDQFDPDQEKPEHKNIFNNIDDEAAFYSKAKHEVQGNNLPQTQESLFYETCRQQGLLAFPIFKCLNNNEMKIQGQTLEKGYCMAIAQMIQQNQLESKHLLFVHLDDCQIIDEAFSWILGAITDSVKFAPSLQSLSYSNNEFGEKSAKQLIRLLQEAERGKGLRELVLSNVRTKSMKVMREFTDQLAYLSSISIQVMSFQGINLNNPEIVKSMDEFIRQNSSLRSISLSQCSLQGWQIVTLFRAIRAQGQVKRIDFSDNSLSELKEKNQMQKAVLIYEMAQFLEESMVIESINLQGLLLGKLLLYLVPYIKRCKSLQYFNISTNLLGNLDKDYFIKELEIDVQRNLDCVREQHDVIFQNSFSFFQRQHLNAEFSMIKQDIELASKSKSAQALYEQIINGGIIKTLHMDRSLNERLTSNSNTGSIIALTGTKKIVGLDDLRDNLVLTREGNTNYELCFNRLLTDTFDTFDFKKRTYWTLKPNQAKAPLLGSPGQYVVILLDLTQMDSQFQEITDKRVIELLKKKYCIETMQKILQREAQEEAQDRRDRKDYYEHEGRRMNEHPLVFGTVTEWQMVQTRKLYQYVASLLASSVEEQRTLSQVIFDEVRTDLATDFPALLDSVIPVFKRLVKIRNAQLVGKQFEGTGAGLSRPDLSKAVKDNGFVYAGFVKPGKHSVFVYEPVTDKFYKKVIVVQRQRSQFDYFEASQTKKQETGQTNRRKSDAVNQNLSDVQFKLIQQKFQVSLSEALQNDTRLDLLSIGHLFSSSSEIQEVLQGTEMNYRTLVILFKELQSESHETYPLISRESLQSFCEQSNLISPQCFQDEPFKKLQSVNRSQFILFIITVYTIKKAQSQSFSLFLEESLTPLIKGSTWLKTKKLIVQDAQIQKLIEVNRISIYQFLDLQSQLYGLTLKRMHDIMIERAGLSISKHNLRKFYILSKNIAVNEHSISQETMDFNEFLEFVFRIAEYIYDPNSYEGQEGKVPKEISSMFEEPINVKFKQVLRALLAVEPFDGLVKRPEPEQPPALAEGEEPPKPKKQPPALELVDEDNQEQVLADREKKYLGFYDIAQFMPEPQRPELCKMLASLQQDQP